MSGPWYLGVLGVLAVWRVTRLLQAEDGPWDLVIRLRRAAGTGMLGRLLDCFYCLSLWIALPAALLVGRTVMERLLLWPALSGGAILLERVTAPVEPARYVEDEEIQKDEEDDHGMLRTAEGEGGPHPERGEDG